MGGDPPPARGFCHERSLFVRLGVSCLDAVRVPNQSILGFVNVICPCGGYVSDTNVHEWRQGQLPFHWSFCSTPITLA